jgi:hypothetical protein
MADKTFTITAGEHEVIEVTVSEDKLMTTIRSAENHAEAIGFPSSMVGTLIKVLRDAEKFLES